jgi:hypothetical protein
VRVEAMVGRMDIERVGLRGYDLYRFFLSWGVGFLGLQDCSFFFFRGSKLFGTPIDECEERPPETL